MKDADPFLAFLFYILITTFYTRILKCLEVKGSVGFKNLSVENLGGRGFLNTGGLSHFPRLTTQGFYFK